MPSYIAKRIDLNRQRRADEMAAARKWKAAGIPHHYAVERARSAHQAVLRYRDIAA